jgi:hypothetical protein
MSGPCRRGVRDAPDSDKGSAPGDGPGDLRMRTVHLPGSAKPASIRGSHHHPRSALLVFRIYRMIPNSPHTPSCPRRVEDATPAVSKARLRHDGGHPRDRANEPAETCVDGRLRGHDAREWTMKLPSSRPWSGFCRGKPLCDATALQDDPSASRAKISAVAWQTTPGKSPARRTGPPSSCNSTEEPPIFVTGAARFRGR